MNKIVGIVAKEKIEQAHEACQKLIAWLGERKIDFRLEQAMASAIGSIDQSKVLSREQFTSQCDPIVVLGGDGTLISVCRHPSKVTPTVIAVNFGTLGFLTEVRLEELFPMLESVLAGTARTEKRNLVQATVFQGDKPAGHFNSFNDVVITKGALARIFAVDISINAQLAAKLRGDGVIIATPSGSTAYSLAAGGSIVHPQVHALLVTPICPHSLTSRPLVVPGDFEVELKVGSESSQVYLTVDGQSGMPLGAGDRVVVKTSSASVQFAKSSKSNYFRVLGEKLKWANN